MRRFLLFLFFIWLAGLQPVGSNTLSGQEITDPESFFGFQPGTDRKMFSYASLMGYLMKLEQETEMMRIIQIGQSEFGRPMYLVFISSAENIRRLEELREINRRLALDANIPDNERQKLIENGRAFVLVTLSMHSNEVGPSQAAPLMAYNLIAGVEPDMTEHLDNVVFMMVPSHNPDGHDMMVEHYNKYLGTHFEGSILPGVYHKYVGHNINRDFITLSMKENQAVADIYNLHWHPHVLVEKHQMGMSGVRYFVPPNHDPIALNIDETLWSWSWVFGSAIARDMTAKGLQGISQHYLFDNYWPGATQTSLWKNIISLLTEAASSHLATPVHVELNELDVAGKGLSEYAKSINMPAPWMGGRWGLSEIVKYEVESIYPLIRTASRQKDEILTSRNDLVRKEVNRGKTEAPFYYILPAIQHDTSELNRLLQLMFRHGVNIYQLGQDAIVEGRAFFQGDYVIPLAQPFRPFIKEVMESQEYPIRRYTPGGEIIRPYDITSWSLPLHRGISSVEINTKQQQLNANLISLAPDDLLPLRMTSTAEFLVFNGNYNESFSAAFRSLTRGIEVYRSSLQIIAEGKKLPAGSFLVRVTGRNQQIVD
ncbi:MAG TPA: M14 family zinc carboxypeptidase, partial [Bacteroidales bacterium]|nr:M14 family zinc carboxypeptidase [Bacteroidales bacterium]